MLIVDTGFLLALANRKDAAHQSATQLFQKLENEEFITTWCVVTETCYLMQKRVGIDAPKLFIRKIAAGMVKIFDLDPLSSYRTAYGKILKLTNGLSRRFPSHPRRRARTWSYFVRRLSRLQHLSLEKYRTI
nr:hypothetical protein [Pseudanabaena sp. UWO310]